MPNIIRRPRSRQPERRHNRACTPGTRLTYEERRRIYHLSQHQGLSQRAIATTLHLPRTTVQSAIHAIAEGCRLQQNCTQRLIMPVSEIASAAESSHNIDHTIKEGEQVHTAFRQPHLLHPMSTTPLVPSTARSTADDRYGQPLQPTMAAYHRDNHYLNSLLTKSSALQQFNAHRDTSETSMPPIPPTLPQMEPRAMYKSP